MFTCDRCGGSSRSKYCENPSCPNMPCCGQPKDKCSCYELEQALNALDIHFYQELDKYNATIGAEHITPATFLRMFTNKLNLKFLKNLNNEN